MRRGPMPFRSENMWLKEEGFKEVLKKWWEGIQLPRVVRMRLEQIQRDFMWGGKALEQKPHLVRWPIVCVDKRKGGLGVKSLGTFNGALLGKWVGALQLKESLDNEEKRWGGWTPCFNRPFNDWELEEMERLLCCLDGKKVRVDEEDRVRWMDSKDGFFSPKLSFFVWEASWGRVLTLDRLQKRGWASTIDAFCAKRDGGALLWVRKGRWRGKWDRYACFGSFGRLGIQLLLRIACCPFKG
ncbi:hypothetical protein CK203_037748 [Vitis vinifera]|uniref:Uncharacterized protein n=1 Tax=Vitis vinifera TaxID=29760 RepID=A0A438IHI7_VITVI|nr:hypothetical protein CK203_037748 [Vitis vinifera]